jgi:hypothetical protein
MRTQPCYHPLIPPSPPPPPPIGPTCSYPTVKMVKIQDARLGMFKFFMIFCIALYVAIFQLWRDGGYLQTEKVSGTARFTLQQPTKNLSGYSNACSPTDADCINDFTPLDKLPYCTASPQNVSYPDGKEICQYYENVGLLTMMESSVIITTRVTETRQDLDCDQENYNITGTTCPKVRRRVGGGGSWAMG